METQTFVQLAIQTMDPAEKKESNASNVAKIIAQSAKTYTTNVLSAHKDLVRTPMENVCFAKTETAYYALKTTLNVHNVIQDMPWTTTMTALIV